MLVEIRDSPIQESCLWKQLMLQRKARAGDAKTYHKLFFFFFFSLLTEEYFLLSYGYILKDNRNEFFRLTLHAMFLMISHFSAAELENDHTPVTWSWCFGFTQHRPAKAGQSFSLPVRQEQWDSPSSFWRLTQKKCHQWKSLRQRNFTDKHKPVVPLVMSALHSTD